MDTRQNHSGMTEEILVVVQGLNLLFLFTQVTGFYC